MTPDTKALLLSLQRRIEYLEQEATKQPVRWPGGGLGSDVTEWFRHFQITAVSKDGTNDRWSYTAKRRSLTTSGHGGWANHSVDTGNYTLYSKNDDMNGATGLYGNGTNSTNFPGSYDIKEIPVNCEVVAIKTPLEGSTPQTYQWWIINQPNGVDGTC